MRATQRDQPAFDSMLAVLDTGRCPQALRRNGADGCKRILDAVMQFLQNELLQFVGSFAFLGVDAGLRKQNLGVDTGLFEAAGEGCRFRRSGIPGTLTPALPAGWLCARFRMQRLYDQLGDIARYDFQCALTDHVLHFRDHLLHLERLSKEAAVGGLSLSVGFNWPETRMILITASVRGPHEPASDRPCSRHLNIREQQLDIGAGLKNSERVVGIDGFEGVKPASSTISTARMRSIISSSTTRTWEERRIRLEP